MPPRRRATPSAAKLPASRLPLGTHLPGDGRPTSRNTDRSAPSPRAASSESDTATYIHIDHHPTYTSSDSPFEMASFDMPPTGQPTYSLAEAKLRRQQERIENAEAALAAPPHHLDRRETSRGKSKPASKPLDIEWSTPAHDKNEGGIPVQTRINTIYGPAFSRGTSLSRSLSSVSQQTTATDAARHDSFGDNAGFQVYHGRRGRKHTDELGATEDTKPETRQSTVEGNFDKREMYKVFGLELPGLDFISSNCGFKNGQLQFVQHPNGDVSAHMWSVDRFVWENIGDFSNIRKKIGGQLASDRLKGETGWQMLQRNTLAYFRAIAKQREQNALGVEFGQAEIQQLLPQPSESTKPPEALRPASPAISTSSRQRTVPMPPLFNPASQQSIASSAQRNVQQPRQVQAPSAGRGFPFLSDGQAPGKEDPFSPSAIFLPAKEPAVPSARAVPTAQPTRHQTFASTSSNPFVSSDPVTQYTVQDATSRDHHVAATTSVVSGLPQLNIAKLGAINIGQQVEHRQTSGTNSDTPSRKQATPTSTREAMREQLWKVSEVAQKRSNSQANIRTVLHDPFKAPSIQSEESKADHFPDFDVQSETDGSFIYVNKRQQPHHSWRDLQPNLNAPKPEPIAVVRPEEDLADSVPDTDALSVGSRVTSFQSSGATYVVEDLLPKTTTVGRKSYDEELKDWWTSGNQFARQEDLYQRIKALEMSRPTPQAPKYMTTTPSTRPRPIGAPPSGRYSSSTTDSPRKADVPYNKTMTRMLIPVYENLASYVQGPIEQRRDYWSNWSQPPEWCIDRSPNGNNSFYDGSWGQPPARVGRDPRYRPLPGELRFGGFSPGAMTGSPRGVGIPGMRGSLGFGGVGMRY